MLAEHNEVLDANAVLLGLQVVFLDEHEDVNLVQSQLEVLLFGFYDLQGHILPVFVVVGSYHIAEGTAAEAFDQLVAVPDVIMLAPQIVALQVVLGGRTAFVFQAYVIYCFLVDDFDPFQFAEELTVLLQHFLPVHACELPRKCVLYEIRTACRFDARPVAWLSQQLTNVLANRLNRWLLLLFE